MKLKSLDNIIRLTVNDDPTRVVEFCPDDVGFVNRFYNLMDNVEVKEAEYNAKLEEIQKDTSINSFGVPNALKKEVVLSAETCAYMREQVDMVFGEGTSQTAFGDMNVPAMFGEFFDEIAPHITAARNKATKKYTGKKAGAGQ